MVRGALLARGLTDEELAQGWRLYSELNGFGGESGAQAATPQTAAAQALNQLDAWDAPNFNAARAVLDAHHPDVSRFLFDSLAPAVGPAAAAGVELLLSRMRALRDGKAKGVSPEQGRAAVELLAQRKIVDAAREAELRALIDTKQLTPRWGGCCAAPHGAAVHATVQRAASLQRRPAPARAPFGAGAFSAREDSEACSRPRYRRHSFSTQPATKYGHCRTTRRRAAPAPPRCRDANKLFGPDRGPFGAN